MSAPVDQAARDRVVTSLDETLFVDVGAGSGKTTQLVGRVVELVRTGVPMADIAAITFTEAAAAELRDRVRRRLAGERDDLRDGVIRERVRTALDEIDQAALQTLHSFAQSILRRYPVEAGLPPTVEVADEISSALAFEDRFELFLRELFADEAWHPVLRRFLVIGGSTQHLRDVAHILNDNYDRLDRRDVAEVAPPKVEEIDVSAVVAALERAATLRARCVVDDDLLAHHLDERVEPELERVRDLDGDRGIEGLRAFDRWAFRYGKAPAWDGCKPEVQAALAEADQAKADELERHTVTVLGALASRVQAFVLHAADERRANGQLEFHDLLVLARDLIRDHPDVRRRLAEAHRFLLVDEFQDTDPLQLEIASLIAGGDSAGSWDELSVAPGRIFFVGDPKQSIYRFRRADVSLYVDVRRHYGPGLCELSANFRTVPGVIEWVNHVFDELMGEGTAGQPGYVPLAAVRPPLSDVRPPVTVLGGPLELRADAIRQQSGQELAEWIGTMVREQWPIVDGGTERPARFGDVVVLVPSRLAVPALEDAFGQADVPYRLETASLIWSSQEIREVLSVLRAVDDPGDEVNLVAALRSPMLGCGDDDLTAWRRAGGRWSYLFGEAPDLGAAHPVAQAMAALRGLHEARWWLGPEGLVEELATRFGTFQFAVLAGGRRDRWRRLRFLADQAQSFVESRRGDLTEFLRWADLQQSEVVRVTSPVLPEADLEAVRVMTIHASKGLEFPVVALFGLGSQRSARSRVSVLWGDAGPEVKFGSKGSTVDYESLAPADEQMEQAERIRLLYVAATRAQDRLVVCAHHKASKKPPTPGNESLGLLLGRHQPEDRPDLVAEWVPGRQGAAPASTEAPTVGNPGEPEVVRAAVERAGFEASRAALVAHDRAVWSATAVAKAAAGPEEAARVLDTDTGPETESDETTHGRRGRAGTAVGRAVHGTLQLVDLHTLEGLDGIARSQAEAEGIDAMLPTVAGLARAAAGAPIIRELVTRPHWREMYVAAPVGGVMVEGYVDLLADDGAGGLVVLDYKTDSVSSEAQVAERTGRYRLQAATYALALEEVTGRRVTRAVFLFLSGAAARESDVVDLEAAKDEVRAVLARS